MRKYSLYYSRKMLTPPPKGAVKTHLGRYYRWYIFEGKTDEDEKNRCDLVYVGEGMTYERCIAEIDRLERSGGK